ncbi:MAG: porin [Urechidicola sp.]|nr:porin [Urechidicola sp.]
MKKTLLTVFTICSLNSFAQEVDKTDEKSTEETKIQQLLKNVSLSGSIDTYFRQNIGGPNGEDAIAPNTSFANLNGFALGMANLVLSYEGEKVGFTADFVVGPRGEDATFLSPFLRPDGTSSIINQMFVYWNVTDKLKLTMGNFNTFLGYEVISPVGNFNYSTSYMFSYGPFSHTGIKADYSINDDWSALIAVMNNTDATEFNFDNNYTLGAQIGFKGTYLNFLYGKQGGNTDATFQADITTGFDLTDAFYLGLNSTYNTTDEAAFYGVALYPQYSFSDAFALGLRGEYFAEIEGGAGAIGGYDLEGDANVVALTLTGSYAIGGLTIKPELRIDNTSEDTFLDADLDPTSSLSSFVLAAIYSF